MLKLLELNFLGTNNMINALLISVTCIFITSFIITSFGFSNLGNGLNSNIFDKNPSKSIVIGSSKTVEYFPPGSAQQIMADEKRIECIMSLKEEYKRIVGSYIKGRHAILVDTVDHGNLGDSFIQVGEVMAMKEFANPPKQPCSVMICNFTSIREEVNEFHDKATLLLHGGGNLGDFWRGMTIFKHSLVKKFSDIPIVSLPQSVYYAHTSLAYQDAKVFRAHSNLTILLRDTDSLNFIRDYYENITSLLSPDGAFMIGPIDKKKCVPKWDVLVLSRRDLEKDRAMGLPSDVVPIFERANLSVTITDWYYWKKYLSNRPMPSDRLDWAAWRLNIAIDLFCNARHVITDRLHATILSTLMGIPHVYLDNRSGKINAYRTSNFGPRESCKDEYLRGFRATTWTQAANLMMKLMGKDNVE